MSIDILTRVPAMVMKIQPALNFLSGGGEMGARIRGFDWQRNPLGPPQEWPFSLRTAVRIMLTSRQPIWIGWGEQLIKLYNDPYKSIVGGKHPTALGQPASVVWREIWDDIGPRLESALRKDEGTYDESLLLVMERHGYREETYYTFSYSPIPDDRGVTRGIFCANTDDTQRIIAARRLHTLRELAAMTASANTPEQVCTAAAASLASNAKDLPFSLIYLLNDDGASARLAAHTGVEAGTHSAPVRIAVANSRSWPLAQALADGACVRIDDLRERIGDIATDVWNAPRSAVILPLAQTSSSRPAGFLIAGLSPLRPFGKDYESFCQLVAGQITTAIANACAFEAERKRAESLAEIDRVKTAFFSNVSHEFRTPLTLMLGPLQDLRASIRSESSAAAMQQGEQLDLIQRNSLRLLKLVNSLLDFSRIEAGRAKATYEETDLAAFTADLASVFRSALEKAGLRFVVDCQPLPEKIFVDRDMWEKIVLNLISNAFKFTHEGTIEVKLVAVDERSVDTGPGASVPRSSTAVPHRYAELTVRDTGTGIPEDEIPKVFVRFHRVPGSRGRTHEGTGIGLSLVRELVKLHGGEISLASKYGAGSVFHVRIPFGHEHLPQAQITKEHRTVATSGQANAFVEEAARWLPGQTEELDPSASIAAFPVESLAPSGAVGSGARTRILIADDNTDMREYLKRLLGSTYEVHTVSDGERALEAVKDFQPDLVLSDVMMPKLDGFAVLARLRADSRTQSLPVIMLSARAGEEARVEGLQAGADDYLIKPFSARELLARVGSQLALARVRREAAVAVQESETRFRALFEQAGAGVCLIDPDTGRFLMVNPALCLMLGYTRQELEARNWQQITHPDDLEADAGQANRMLHNEITSYSLEKRCLRKDGSPIWINLYATSIRDADGTPRYAVNVIADISDRKAAEGKATRHSETLQALNRVGKVMAAELDLLKVVQTLTDAATELTNASFGSFFYNVVDENGESYTLYTLSGVPRSAFENFPMPRNTALFGPTFAGEAPVRVEDVLSDPRYGKSAPHYGMPNGHLPVRSYLAVSVISRSGKVYGGLFFGHVTPGMFTEEHERIVVALADQAAIAMDNAFLFEAAERERERARLAAEQLLEADRRKDEFLAILAHELRNPLAPLRNSVEILRIGRNNPQALEHSIAMLDRQVGYMVRLVDDLLDVSRISRGKIDLRKERVDMVAVLQGAIEACRASIDTGSRRVHIDLPTTPVYIDADPVRLAQVFTNLLDNAIKYTERNGSIGIRAAVDGGHALVRIEDNGVGIPAHMLSKVFDIFAQVDRSLEKSRQGLGIGLSIVKKLVELHGGDVSAHSEGNGRGTEFTVRLPIVLSMVAGADDHAAVRPARDAGARCILVADDNKDAAASLATLLEFMGHAVDVVHSGAEAIEFASIYRPDVILLDLGMPGLNGYDTCERIRALNGGKEMLIVAVTGWGQEDDKQRSRAAGFDRHLVKPADPAQLEALLASTSERPTRSTTGD